MQKKIISHLTLLFQYTYKSFHVSHIITLRVDYNSTTLARKLAALQQVAGR